MSKRKPKVVEAWAVVVDGRIVDVSANPDEIGAGAGARTAHLVEADPHAKLKAAVVRAARAMLVALAAPGRDPHGHAELDLLAALGNLDEAVSKLQKVKS